MDPANSSKWSGVADSNASEMPQQQQPQQHQHQQLQHQPGSFGMSSRKQQGPAATLRHTSSSAASVSNSDAHLFSTPTDLVCPITLTLFQDPVCNALGQVYERAALQRHLLQAAVSGQPPTDPVSNAVLPSLELVPIWPMRSRAAEYRDNTIRACVQAAAAPDCPDPVRYLRRAAELVLSSDPAIASRLSSSSSGSATPTAAASTAAGSPPGTRAGSVSSSAAQPGSEGSAAAGAADAASSADSKAAAAAAAGSTAGPCEGGARGGSSTGAPGLTVEFAQYLAAHQGSQYDALILKYFGNELLRAGCPDAASHVFYRLLLEAEDRVQQAEYLQLCLDCWTCSNSEEGVGGAGADDSSNSSSSAAGVKAGSGKAGGQGAAAAAAGPAASMVIVNKLADFVQRQRCLSPRAIVQMLESTHHGAAMAMQLCQVLLARAAVAAAAAGPGGNAEAALELPGGLGGVLEVLLELIELGNGQLVERVQQLTRQVQEMQQQQGGAAQGGGVALSTQAGVAGEAVGGAVVAEGAAAAGGTAAAGNGTARRRSSRRGHSWKGGKGVDVLVGRVARLAAAGTLAVASLAGGNHPLLRAARVGPLLYLLRAGL